MVEPDFTDAARNTPIYEGFGAEIRRLNREIVSPFQKRFPGGRGYAKPGGLHARPFDAPKVYAGPVHAMSVGGGDATDLLQQLRGKTELHGEIYMGTAGFMNLSYIGATRPGAAIFYDINPIQTLFWNHALPLIARADSGAAFLDALVESSQNLQHKVSRLFRHGGQRGMMGTDMKPGLEPDRYILFTYIGSPLTQWRYHKDAPFFSWVNRPDEFAHIRAMARSDAIGAITLDALDPAGWKQIADYLATRPDGAPDKVKTLFVSNIIEFLTNGMDYTWREDPNATPVHARRAMAQVLCEKGYGIITDRCDLAMRWPESTRSTAPKHAGKDGPDAF